MKAAILDELKGATFAVDLTALGAPFQATQDDVQRVFDHLGFTHVTLFADGHSTIENPPRLPPCGFEEETDSYGPLTHFLNTIVHAANSCLTGPRYLASARLKLLETPGKASVTGRASSSRVLVILDLPGSLSQI